MNLPLLEIKMVVPEVKHEVRMFISAEVEKLKSQITQQIEHATQERLCNLESQINEAVEKQIAQSLQEIIRELVWTILNSEAIHNRIYTALTTTINNALDQLQKP